MKIIFLDIDGVLNGYNKWNIFGYKIADKLNIKKYYKKIIDPFGVHKSKVKRLAKIVRKTGAKVVLSSSWRYRYWKYANSMTVNKNEYDPSKWSNNEYDNDIEKLYWLFKKFNIDVIDITERYSGERCRRDIEIQSWLNEYESSKYYMTQEEYDPITNYIILDDENMILLNYHGDERFIQTSSIYIGQDIVGLGVEDTGLKRKHVKLAIQILNR